MVPSDWVCAQGRQSRLVVFETCRGFCEFGRAIFSLTTMNRFIVVMYDLKHGQARFDALEVATRPGDTPKTLLKRATTEADSQATDRDLVLVDVDTVENYEALARRAHTDEPDFTA
jgi:hypothetical protein